MSPILLQFPDWETWQWLKWVLALCFFFAFGACAGSFLNVVIFRLPRDMSVVNPPSRCPRCAWRLRWHQNLPVVSWCLLRGRCAACRTGISPQYPMIEVLGGLLLAGLAALLYLVPPGGFWSAVGGEWWLGQGFSGSWPAFICWAFALLGLLAMLIIDARTFLIPIQIPTCITLVCFVFWGVQGLLPEVPLLTGFLPIPSFGWSGTLAAFAGLGGVLLGVALLRSGLLRYSFSDYEDFLEEGAVLADYPHARREMGLEVLFLIPCMCGLALGWFLGSGLEGRPGPFLAVLGGSIGGWLIAGAVVWVVRILGTLAFGREAMGMGDVHLMAAMGAAFGWIDPVVAFFIAPFLGLAWVLAGLTGGRVLKGLGQELPYGPHLAVALFLVVFLKPVVIEAGQWILPGIQSASTLRLAEIAPTE
ncbi:MAG: prepilin peptidase [Planctomycetota bacterium]|nr:prepilin peptidase [Planctomycetota bacterium]MED6306526.1 prepilin peptidase [Planctomycetota bacterium]